jgi:hypothetical protein
MVVRYFIVVDDGAAESLTPWVVVPDLATGCAPGREVQLRGQPWSRHVTELTPMARRRNLAVS